MLEKRKYSYLDNLQGNDKLICEELENRSGYEYICDAINEIADNFIEVYNSPLFDIGFQLYAGGYCEESEKELGNKGIIEILQGAHYLYNRDVLYQNLENIIENIAINYINEQEYDIDEDDLNSSELDLFKSIDTDNYISDITDLVDEYMKDKITGILEEFDVEQFADDCVDGLIDMVLETDNKISNDASNTLLSKLEENIDFRYEYIEKLDLEDEYEELLENLQEEVREKLSKKGYDSITDDETITVYNTPKIIVKELEKELLNKEFTVKEVDTIVRNEIVSHDTIEDEYLDELYDGDSNMYIFDNLSMGYYIALDCFYEVNVEWEIVKKDEEDIFNTIVKVTEISLV